MLKPSASRQHHKVCLTTQLVWYSSDYFGFINSQPLNALGLVFLIDAAIGTLGIDTAGRWEFLIVTGTVDILLEDGVLLDVLELGLEVLQTGSVGAAVGSTTSVGKIEAFILDLFTVDTPV